MDGWIILYFFSPCAEILGESSTETTLSVFIKSNLINFDQIYKKIIFILLNIILNSI